MSNYTFCIQGQEGLKLGQSDARPPTKCCKSDSQGDCPEAYNSTWNCTNAYSDKAYAKFVCPFKKDKCGENMDVALDQIGETKNVTVQNLTRNDTCFYKVKAKCGAPSVTPNTTDNVQIEFVEFSLQILNSSAPINGRNTSSNSTDKKNGRSEDKMPPRGQTFERPTNQSNQTNQGKSEDAKVLSGSYNQSRGGAKVWGNAEQQEGASKKGKKLNITEPDCSDREMYVVITGTNDTATTTLLLQFDSVSFASESSAVRTFAV